MNEDWGKAIAQLCTIIQNDTDLKEPVLQYVEFMKTIYGMNGTEFLDIYREWERSGEIVDRREKTALLKAETAEKRIYPESLEGLNRLLDEGVIDETAFCEILSEEPFETRELPDGKVAGFYPQYPGCIGYAKKKTELKKVMEKSLKNWICASYILWKENKILVK